MNFSFTGKKKWTLAFFPSSKFWSLSHPMSFKRPKQTVRHKQKNTRPWKKSNSPWLWEHGSNKSDVNRKQAEIFNMKKQNLPQKMKQQKTHELRAPCLSPHMNIWSLSEVVRREVGCCKGAVGYWGTFCSPKHSIQVSQRLQFLAEHPHFTFSHISTALRIASTTGRA